MAGIEMGMEDFLGHKPTEGNNAKFMDNWKKREPPVLNMVFHTKAAFIAVYQHNWPRIVTREKDGVQSTEVWGGNYNSWEVDAVNKAQRQRDRQTGKRSTPPTVCPMALMLERVYQGIRNNEIDWTDSLFKFEGDDPDKARILHAGGMVGMFQQRDMSDKKKSEMRAAGIYQKDAWQENVMAKCNYLFAIADVDNPGNGVQLLQETTLVGDCIKGEMTKQCKQYDPAERWKGNPLKNPYIIQLEYYPNEKEFQKKYTATAMPAKSIPADIASAIQSDPPDMQGPCKRGDIVELRTSMETHYIGPADFLDFDEIFGPAEALLAEEAKERGEEPPAPSAPESPETTVGEQVAEAKKAVEAAAAPDEETEPCPTCGFDLAMDATECPKCGARFEFEDDEGGEEEAPEPEPEPASKASGKRSGITF